MSSTALDTAAAHLTRDWVIDASNPLRDTGSKKLGDITQMQAIFDWPGLYKLAAECDRLFAEQRGADQAARRLTDTGARPARAGRRRSHPTAVLLAIAISARVTGTLGTALNMARDDHNWHGRIQPVWESREETEMVPFPVSAPNRDQVRHFTRRLLAIPGWERALQERFQRVSVAQARALGNLDPDAQIDWTHPSLAHTVIGDGCVITPFSSVECHVDPATGEVFHPNSRAQNKPRVAPTGTDLRADGKSHLHGLNMVHLLTPTEYGWVVLGTGTAQGAEQWASLDLLDSVAPLAKGGIHNLLWDRVYTGWLLDYALAKHRIRVFNKSAGHNEPTTRDPGEDVEATQRHRADEELRRITSEDLAQVKLAEIDGQRNELVERSKRLESSIFRTWRTQDLHEIFRRGEPQPLGLSLYRSTSASTVTGSRNQAHRDKMEIVRSKFTYFGTRTHDSATGPCTHELFVDDGALHSVEDDSERGCLVKVATATCTHSQPRRRAGGRWGTDEVWQMPCPNGDFAIRTEWDPQHHRWTPQKRANVKKTRDEVALNELRPISRSHAQAFADIANHRNNAESFNQWYQRRLPHHGRAASLSADGQAFDFLAGACVVNAITWTVWQQSP